MIPFSYIPLWEIGIFQVFHQRTKFKLFLNKILKKENTLYTASSHRFFRMTQIKPKEKHQKVPWERLSTEKKNLAPAPRYRDIFFSIASTKVKGGERQSRIPGIKKRSSSLPATPAVCIHQKPKHCTEHGSIPWRNKGSCYLHCLKGYWKAPKYCTEETEKCKNQYRTAVAHAVGMQLKVWSWSSCDEGRRGLILVVYKPFFPIAGKVYPTLPETIDRQKILSPVQQKKSQLKTTLMSTSPQILPHLK